jgi:uncharacterized integral membrane protein (TIGR00698 family)
LPFYSPVFRRYSPGLAVISGALLAATAGNPFQKTTAKLTHPFLSWSIVGMGCGMSLYPILRAGLDGFAYTICGIIIAMTLGWVIGKKLKLPRDTSILISTGTAICGGSAIAAMAPVLRAKSHDIAVATVTVFILNAVALILFPFAGHLLGLSETQFGFWAALAIHDTSSVVGASYQYGPVALDVGTTVKLARALWIVPLTICVAYIINRRSGDKTQVKAKFPWFIPGFLFAAALVTFVRALSSAGSLIKELAQHLMIVTLFLIGNNLSREKMRELGLRPMIQGVSLWLTLAVSWLIFVRCCM